MLRSSLGGHPPAGSGQALLALAQLSDAHVLDTVSPARCEWVETLAQDPRWALLLPMHRPQEALAHFALAAHVQGLRREPRAPLSGRPYDLALSTGDAIDNAQRNELDAFLAILAGGTAQLTALGGVQQAGDMYGDQPWPFWCPQAAVADRFKPMGYPVIEDFVARASAPVASPGLGFPFASLPGNHDFLVQGTALPDAALAAIAVGDHKLLRQPPGLDPADPLNAYLEDAASFSRGPAAWTRRVEPLATRHFVDRREWVAAHVAAGAAGLGADHARRGSADTVIDTEHARVILLDSNHPAGDFQGSLGRAQLAWLDERLAETGRERGRFAVVTSHHGSVSLTNTRGHDPDRLLSEAVLEVLHRHACVKAWITGHRHRHRVRPRPGRSGGFWEITTASLIDWPSQTRAIEFLRHGDGQMEICCTLLDHGADPASLAGQHLDLARRVAGDAMARDMSGEASDGNVRLVLPA